MAYRISYSRGQSSMLGPIGFLIIINVVLWVATSIRPEFFITTFGLSKFTFLDQPWTIVTTMFIHAPFPRFGHVLGNMFTLFFFGNFLKGIIGERNFFIVYFVGGLVGSLFFLLMSSTFSLAYGASGAVSAVAGALMVLRPRLKVFIFPFPVPVPIWAAVIGLFVVLSIIVPGIAWQAHLGGVVGGAVIGYLLKRR